MQGADRDLVKVWQKMNAPRFDNIMLKTKTVGGEATADGIRIRFEGEGAPKEPQLYDLVLQAVGRVPNGKRIGADKAGVAVGERGFIPVDIQMRTNVPPHLRDRRHRRPADAGAQGDARGPRRRRGRGRRAVRRREAEAHRVQRPRDPERRLHRSGGRVGRRHRGRGQGERHEDQEGPVPVERFRPGDRERARRRLHEAAVQRGDATRSSAAASSARMRAT